MAEEVKNQGNGDAPQDKTAVAEKVENGANGHGESGLALRTAPQTQGIQVAESFLSAGQRPIAADQIEVFGTILNNRPIEASHLRVLSYAGSRPIFASEIAVRDDLSLPGGRPIVASDPKLMHAALIVGGRPIASNEIDDPASLMGFLD